MNEVDLLWDKMDDFTTEQDALLLLGVIADWYGERSKPEEIACREIIQRRLFPEWGKQIRRSSEAWQWWDITDYRPRSSQLEEEEFSNLSFDENGWRGDYKKLSKAYLDLIRVINERKVESGDLNV